MAYPKIASAEHLRDTLRRELALARSRTDEIFQMLSPEAIYERPIAERHRFVFYLGHLDAFDWNMICDASFGAAPFNREFDELFAFGIDPIDGRLPDDQPSDWPGVQEVHAYVHRVRQTVDDFLDTAKLVHSPKPFVEDGQIFWVAIEHRLMHAETLAYMAQWIPYHQKKGNIKAAFKESRSAEPRMIEVPAGMATLGQNRTEPYSFGWDNEFEAHNVFVPEFSIDAFNVTNGQFLDFVRAGGYEQRQFWNDNAWQWIERAGIRHPKFWNRRGDHWFYRTMFEEIPMPGSWPVYVSHAEAEAYTRWIGKSLPTEAQYHRATFASQRSSKSNHEERVTRRVRGNFDFQSWTPVPVGAYPASAGSPGIFDLIGNGWEWTSTQFEPFDGFEPFPFYPGYSANFFDGEHYVMKGASPRTSGLFVRSSFRNWFQPYYQNVYAAFRCVEN